MMGVSCNTMGCEVCRRRGWVEGMLSFTAPPKCIASLQFVRGVAMYSQSSFGMCPLKSMSKKGHAKESHGLICSKEESVLYERIWHSIIRER
mmetsp:Transcript_11846/g.19955  ORF Transcript_11846/g.19955 Transcript_11846/m.19955 type:complete len:92 (-) Transcript_11846:203-478(-)